MRITLTRLSPPESAGLIGEFVTNDDGRLEGGPALKGGKEFTVGVYEWNFYVGDVSLHLCVCVWACVCVFLQSQFIPDYLIEMMPQLHCSHTRSRLLLWLRTVLCIQGDIHFWTTVHWCSAIAFWYWQPRWSLSWYVKEWGRSEKNAFFEFFCDCCFTNLDLFNFASAALGQSLELFYLSW